MRLPTPGQTRPSRPASTTAGITFQPTLPEPCLTATRRVPRRCCRLRRTPAGGLAINLNARLDDNSAFGTFFTYRAGAAYRLGSGTRIRGSVGRSFKAPTFCEQYCDAPFVVGDSSLRPERSTSWEAGIEQDLVPGGLSVWATYFNQRFRDMVVYDASGAPGDPTYRNGAAARSRGLETGASVRLGTSASATASY